MSKGMTGVTVGVGERVGVPLMVGVEETVWVGIGVIVPVSVGVGVTVRVGVAVAVGLSEYSSAPMSQVSPERDSPSISVSGTLGSNAGPIPLPRQGELS